MKKESGWGVSGITKHGIQMAILRALVTGIVFGASVVGIVWFCVSL